MKSCLFLLALFLCISCKNNSGAHQKVKQLELELEKNRKELAVWQAKAATDFPLVHMVYLNLNEDISTAQRKTLMAAIAQLSSIPEVKELEVGNFKNLNDARAMSDFEVFFQMNFANEADYAVYQAHAIHLELKKVAKGLLAGAPVTYDYLMVD